MKKTHIPDEYEQQAIDFLKETETEFKAHRMGTFPYFEDDEEERDVYQVTLTRKRHLRDGCWNAKKDIVYSFRFGDSIANTRARLGTASIGYGNPTRAQEADYQRKQQKAYRPPNAYDVLACLTHYDPGTFSDFCSDFGYDTDSIKAQKSYFAVQDEWDNLTRLFSSEELDKLAEIN